MKIKPILFIIGMFVLIGTIVYLGGKYVLDTVFGGACGNEVKQEIPSPDGEKMAVIFQRDCGATTGYTYELTILDTGEALHNKKGNTFRSAKEFTLEWVEENKIEVVYKEFADTYKKDKRVNGVRIDYIGGR